MSVFRFDRLVLCSVLVFIALLELPNFAAAASARRREEPVFATSADDPALRIGLAALSPNVRPGEAQQVARCAYMTGREFRREWQVVWPPGVQNFLVNTGARKGGLCFQWAGELLLRLDALKLKTLEIHWAESFIGTMSEHNVIVVTAKGQPFAQGILLDNWRYGGRLVWGLVSRDPHYDWKENQAEVTRRLPKTISRRPPETRSKIRRAKPARRSGKQTAIYPAEKFISPCKRHLTLQFV